MLPLPLPFFRSGGALTGHTHRTREIGKAWESHTGNHPAGSGNYLLKRVQGPPIALAALLERCCMSPGLEDTTRGYHVG